MDSTASPEIGPADAEELSGRDERELRLRPGGQGAAGERSDGLAASRVCPLTLPATTLAGRLAAGGRRMGHPAPRSNPAIRENGVPGASAARLRTSLHY